MVKRRTKIEITVNTINVIKGYQFNKESDIFTEYINHLYEIKAKSKGPLKAKSLLNKFFLLSKI